MKKIQKQYTDEFRNTLVELYNSGKSLADLSREYGISKSTVTVWINKSKPIVVDKDKTITTAEYQQMLKKMARLEEEIIGHAMSKYMDTTLALQAVKNALKLQKPTKRLILHSDLGTQYTSLEFEKYILNTKIITHSYSVKGCPYDNSCIQSFHASLKKEEVYRVTYYDFNAAKLDIFESIESWYNRIRIHSSIGYISPQKCEDLARNIS